MFLYKRVLTKTSIHRNLNVILLNMLFLHMKIGIYFRILLFICKRNAGPKAYHQIFVKCIVFLRNIL